MEYCVLACSLLAFVLYLNTLPASFAYDDSRAILKNPDLLPSTPLSNILFDDFWGTPLTHSGSHKSYRPICVLTFRINHWLGGFEPWGYHLTNVLLHAIVTGLFTYTAHVLLGHQVTSVVAGALFATHPVHTEAVAGVVGRADILACLFFLLAFLCYIRYCKHRGDATSRQCNGSHTAGGSTGDYNNSSHTNGGDFVNSTLHHVKKTHSPGGDHVSGKHSPGGSSSSRSRQRFLWLLGFALCTLCALLSKEQGITILAVCAVYDAIIVSKVNVKNIIQIYKVGGLVEGLSSITLIGALLVISRIVFMGSTPPEFAPADNPASDSDSVLVRTLTFHHLVTLNIWLLLFPRVLSFDWSMGAVPLVESALDVRNLSTLFLYLVISYVVLYLLRNLNATSTGTSRTPQHYTRPQSNGHTNLHPDCATTVSNGVKSAALSNGFKSVVHRRLHLRRGSDSSTDSSPDEMDPTCLSSPRISQSSLYTLTISLALLVFPFIPASNLFFYVGFVLAERVLYIPSVGFCILVAHGVEKLYYTFCASSPARRHLLSLSVIGLLVSYGARTTLRNQDWRTEENLYKAGIPVNPAKSWGNLANILNNQHRHVEAEEAYRNALQYRGNMADVHYNLGILLQEQKRHLEAIDSYSLAIQCRPRLTMAYLNLGIVYAGQGKRSQAEEMYRKCAEIDITGLKDPRLHEQTKISALYNLGRLLADQERYLESIDIYQEAIQRRPNHYSPQSLYNMLGEAYSKIDRLDDAEYWYKEALHVKPGHIPAHLTMGKLLCRRGEMREAESWFLKAQSLAPEDSSVYQHYGQFLGDLGRVDESAEMYANAVKYNPDDFELLFNTANAYRQASRVHDAEDFYRKCAQLRPQEATAHMNLGAMLHYNGKLDEAEKSYLAALRLKPNDEITRSNLHKVRNLLGKSKHKKP